MKYSNVAWKLAASTLLLCAYSAPAIAADGEAEEQQKEIDRLKKEKEKLTAEKDLITERAALEKARIDALGLPKFDGKQTINDGSIAIEASLLVSSAVDSTADKIKTALGSKLDGKRLLVLAGTETPDFGQAAMMRFEIGAIANRLDSACGCASFEVAGAGIVPIVTAVAGLLKSDTELKAVDATVDAKVLAAVVASKLPNAFLPSASIGDPGGGKLMDEFKELLSLAGKAQRMRDGLAEVDKPTDEQKAQLARLNAALARFESFFAKVTTANDKGVVPMVAAARMEQMLAGDPLVLRVNAEKSGGTLLKRTNLITMLGGESVKISGGVVTSYVLTEPNSGALKAAGVVTCRTTLTTLRRVQEATWHTDRRAKSGAKAVCLTAEDPVTITTQVREKEAAGS